MTDYDVGLILSAALELAELIKEKNERLLLRAVVKGNDEPEPHDYQTCMELQEVADRMLLEMKFYREDAAKAANQESTSGKSGIIELDKGE